MNGRSSSLLRKYNTIVLRGSSSDLRRLKKMYTSSSWQKKTLLRKKYKSKILEAK